MSRSQYFLDWVDSLDADSAQTPKYDPAEALNGQLYTKGLGAFPATSMSLVSPLKVSDPTGAYAVWLNAGAADETVYFGAAKDCFIYRLAANRLAIGGDWIVPNQLCFHQADAVAVLYRPGAAVVQTNGRFDAQGGLRSGNGTTLAGTIWSGSGVPGAGVGANGDFYFRTDTPGTAGQRIYIKSAGAWVALTS